jgi:putative endonuclease
MAVSRRSHHYWVYILASKPSGTLYVGVTNSLKRRICEHKSATFDGFTRQYGIKTLVHFEFFRSADHAIRREKEIKGWIRAKKIDLIRQRNPLWLDLAASWYHFPMDSSHGSE